MNVTVKVVAVAGDFMITHLLSPVAPHVAFCGVAENARPSEVLPVQHLKAEDEATRQNATRMQNFDMSSEKSGARSGGLHGSGR